MRALDLAETFHRTGEWDYDCGTALLRSLAIGPGMRVVELGSATGRLAIDAAHLVAPDGEVIGFEPSESRFEIARRYYRAGNVTFLHGGPEQLEAFGGGGVDLVYSNLLLHRLDDPTQALRAASRALKAGGTLAFTCPLGSPLLVETLEEVIFSDPMFAPHRGSASGLATWSCRPLDEWLDLVRQAGFGGASAHRIGAEFAFEVSSSLAVYWEAATEGRFLGGLSAAEREAASSLADEHFGRRWGDKPLRSQVEVVAIHATRGD
ncbi:MAG: methyltransferase domain-containing protein [bacterium]|nr:methyltransferase domain-containing protein [bacterium]